MFIPETVNVNHDHVLHAFQIARFGGLCIPVQRFLNVPSAFAFGILRHLAGKPAIIQVSQPIHTCNITILCSGDQDLYGGLKILRFIVYLGPSVSVVPKQVLQRLPGALVPMGERVDQVPFGPFQFRKSRGFVHVKKAKAIFRFDPELFVK